MELSAETVAKRAQFNHFINAVLRDDPVVKGVVGIGSIASGHMHADSDIDAAIFLDPFDPHVVPAEAIWREEDDSFHSIFDASVQGLQVDFLRINWAEWAAPDFEWEEGYRAEIGAGWIAYDAGGELASLIAQKTAYSDELRLQRLDEAIIDLDNHLNEKTVQRRWHTLGPLIAHDRLDAAYSCLVQGLFAYNQRWQIWRNREMDMLLQLPWLPPDCAALLLAATVATDQTEQGYLARAAALRTLFVALLAELTAVGLYSASPVDQAFIRQHEEPGRAWNMDLWTKFRDLRQMARRENGEVGTHADE